MVAPAASVTPVMPAATTVTPSVTPHVTPRPTSFTHEERSVRLVTRNPALDTCTQAYEGPITRSRAKKLQQEVNAFLSGLHFNIDENYILPKSCNLLLLRFIHEATPLVYMEDAEANAKNTKTVVQDEKSYTHKIQGYTAGASSSRACLYQSIMFQGA
uniref:Uncharacterized protein n=1 Tax=Arundo donax TaxID=35708 RepID=A0A0A9H6G7_ARUDO